MRLYKIKLCLKFLIKLKLLCNLNSYAQLSWNIIDMRVKPTLFSHGPQRVFSACFYKRIIPFPLLSSKAVDSFLALPQTFLYPAN